MLTDDQVQRMVRRGYLVPASGAPWKVPADLLDIYREHIPELGADLVQGYYLGQPWLVGERGPGSSEGDA